MKKIILITITLLLFTSCNSFKDQNEDYKDQLIKLQMEYNLQESEYIAIKEKYNNLVEEHNILKNEITNTDNTTLEISIDNITNISIDGELIDVDSEDILINKSKLFISTDFLNEYYKNESIYKNTLLLKGYPIETKIISTDSIFVLNPEDTKFVQLLSNAVLSIDNEYEKVYSLDGLEIGFVEAGNYYLITSSKYQTERGITIGSSRIEVQNAYGKLGDSNEDIWYTFSRNIEFQESHGLQFYFENDFVSKIIYAWD